MSFGFSFSGSNGGFSYQTGPYGSSFDSQQWGNGFSMSSSSYNMNGGYFGSRQWGSNFSMSSGGYGGFNMSGGCFGFPQMPYTPSLMNTLGNDSSILGCLASRTSQLCEQAHLNSNY